MSPGWFNSVFLPSIIAMNLFIFILLGGLVGFDGYAVSPGILMLKAVPARFESEGFPTVRR